MSKDLQSLQASRDRRAEIKAKYGFIPTSIIEADKTDKAIDLMAEERSYFSTANVIEGQNARIQDIFDVSGQSCRGGALSRYPQNIGRYLVKMYSSEGDIVLDPFAGHNSRMELTWRLGRNYIGIDLSRDFMEKNRQAYAMLMAENTRDMFGRQNWIRLYEGNSQNLAALLPPDTQADLSFTSPPYWDLEYYGDEPEQLGTAQTYNQFIHDLGLVLRATVLFMKPGAFCCWSINDFRKGGCFYAYHASVITLFTQCGLALHDIVIVDLGYPIGAAFASQLDDQQRTAKRHEYIIIGQKPK